MLNPDNLDPTDVTIARLKAFLSRPTMDAIDPADVWLAYAAALREQGMRDEQIHALRTAIDLQKLALIEAPTDSAKILDINDLGGLLATELRAGGQDADAEQVAAELHRFLIAFRISPPDRVVARFPRPAQLTPVPVEESLDALDRLLGASTAESGSPDRLQEELDARLHRRRAELLRLLEGAARMKTFQASLGSALEQAPGSPEWRKAFGE